MAEYTLDSTRMEKVRMRSGELWGLQDVPNQSLSKTWRPTINLTLLVYTSGRSCPGRGKVWPSGCLRCRRGNGIVVGIVILLLYRFRRLILIFLWSLLTLFKVWVILMRRGLVRIRSMLRLRLLIFLDF